jgi:mono/diheme cytochrome c family protein
MKMKYYRLSVFCIVIFSLIQCQSQKKVEYELPEAMLPQVKTMYAVQCDKGKVLYDLNCARCHNTTVKGRQVIPDFKPEQLVGYALRVKNAQHEMSMPDTLVTEEELGIIMIFLSYKKKNVITAKK